MGSEARATKRSIDRSGRSARLGGAGAGAGAGAFALRCALRASRLDCGRAIARLQPPLAPLRRRPLDAAPDRDPSSWLAQEMRACQECRSATQPNLNIVSNAALARARARALSPHLRARHRRQTMRCGAAAEQVCAGASPRASVAAYQSNNSDDDDNDNGWRPQPRRDCKLLGAARNRWSRARARRRAQTRPASLGATCKCLRRAKRGPCVQSDRRRRRRAKYWPPLDFRSLAGCQFCRRPLADLGARASLRVSPVRRTCHNSLIWRVSLAARERAAH